MAPGPPLKTTYVVLGLCLFFAAVCSQRSYRLPMEVLPYSYNIHLIPYLDEGDASRQFTFDGNVSIVAQALLPVNTITLHASDIRIHEVSAVTRIDSGKQLNVTTIETDSERELLILHLSEAIEEKRQYEFSFNYTGNLQNYTMGFFRDSYISNGTTRWLAATQFEAVGARRAFPCFDEPALKAFFNISIATPVGLKSLSNMPLQSSVGPDPTLNGRYWDIFQRSSRMSTYLVAFVVSDYEALQSGMYGVWSKPDTVQQGDYALSISPQVIEIMHNITGITYSLPKLDEIAIPKFGGAMENWGLIVYGEEYLLLSDESLEFTIATTIAHELAHQWFGNLVTLNWWSYTWLNEGFATYFQYFVPDRMYPEWNMMDVLVAVQFSMLTTDSSGTTHALTADAETPDEIQVMFDSITYRKGGCVLKMLAHILTFDTFYEGLHFYLQNNAYNDVKPDDLFFAFQTMVNEDGVLADGLTVKGIMDTWTLQSGYPLVTVTRNYSAGTALVQQAQFFTDGRESNSSWYVPLTYTTSEELKFDDPKPSLWLVPSEDVTVENLPGEDQWVIFNIQASGFYRVNYDTHNWELLLTQLNSSDADKINTLNRMQLQEDSYALAQAGVLDWNTAMDMTSFLWKETDPVLWISGLRTLQEHYNKLAGSAAFPLLQSYYLRLMERFYKSVGFERREGESYITSTLRPQLLYFACLLGHEDCTSSSMKSVVRARSVSDYRLNSVTRGIQYCAAVRQGGETAWDLVWSVYQNTDDVRERQEALEALGCTSDNDLLTRLLTLVVSDDSKLKPEDRLNAIASACNGRDTESCDVTLKFIASRVSQLASIFGHQESIPIILIRIAPNLKTQEQVDLLELIISRNRELMSSSEQITPSALNIAKENVNWIETTGSDIIHWLSKH